MINSHRSYAYIESLNLYKYSSIEDFLSKNKPNSFSDSVIKKFLELNHNLRIADKIDPVYLMMTVGKLGKYDQRIICGVLASKSINNFLEMEWEMEKSNIKFIKNNFKLTTIEKAKLRGSSKENKSFLSKLFKKDEYLLGEKFAKKNNVSSYAICELVLSSKKEISGCKSVVYKKKYSSYNYSLTGGYQFSKDCTSYGTGYDWAQENYISEYDDCIGLESSYFYEGCSDYVREYKSDY